MARAAWPHNVLKLVLDEVGPLAHVQAIGRFNHCFMILDATFGRNEVSILWSSRMVSTRAADGLSDLGLSPYEQRR